MEGKVELTIDRYEELASIEREYKRRLDEIRSSIDKFVFDERFVEGIRFPYITRFIGKDDALSEMQKRMDEVIRELTKKDRLALENQADLADAKSAIENARFGKRIKYLFTGEFEI